MFLLLVSVERKKFKIGDKVWMKETLTNSKRQKTEVNFRNGEVIGEGNDPGTWSIRWPAQHQVKKITEDVGEKNLNSEKENPPKKS